MEGEEEREGGMDKDLKTLVHVKKGSGGEKHVY